MEIALANKSISIGLRPGADLFKLLYPDGHLYEPLGTNRRSAGGGVIASVDGCAAGGWWRLDCAASPGPLRVASVGAICRRRPGVVVLRRDGQLREMGLWKTSGHLRCHLFRGSPDIRVAQARNAHPIGGSVDHSRRRRNGSLEGLSWVLSTQHVIDPEQNDRANQ